MRVVAITAYDGSRFFGSQIQKNESATVMGKVGEALRSVGIFFTPLASGRTDTGVHAFCQPIAFDLPSFWEQRFYADKGGMLLEHLNNKLAPYILIKKIYVVKDDFHPRFHATKRVYRYAVKAGRQNPFLSDYITFVEKIDAKRISSAIKFFEGVHDFGLFKKNGSDVKSDVRHMYKTSFYRHGDFFVFKFEANSFLRSQIRLMVGALLSVSDGVYGIKELQEQIECRQKYFTRIAPPNGLYLSKVFY